MRKTLGEYIRLIAIEDQNTMVYALKPLRPTLHRGMLAFVPIEDIKMALRPTYDYNSQYTAAQYAQQLQTAQAQMQVSQARMQLAHAQTGQYISSHANQASTTSAMGVGQYLGSYLTNGIANTSSTYNTTNTISNYPSNTQEVPQTYLFAYAALLAAINAAPGALDDFEEEPKLLGDKTVNELVDA